VQIAAATLSGNSLRQIVHTHRVSVHQAAKLVAALLRVARVTEGLAESNGSLYRRVHDSRHLQADLPRTGISSGTPRSVIEYGLPLPFYSIYNKNFPVNKAMVPCRLRPRQPEPTARWTRQS